MRELELISRIDIFPSWIPYLLFLCVILLALLKLRSDLIFTHLRNASYKPIDSVYFNKEEIHFFGVPNLLLLTNFIITSSIVVYMTLINFDFQPYWLVVIPTGYTILQSLFLYLAGLISGAPKKLKSNFILTNITSHFIGLLLLPLLFVWILNPQYAPYLINIAFALFIALNLFRIIRGVFMAIRNKVLWYYIILYLCTFEIGPALVFFTLIRHYFIG